MCSFIKKAEQQQISLTWKVPVTTFTLMLLRHSATVWGFSAEVKWRLEDFSDCCKGYTVLVSLWANGSSTFLCGLLASNISQDKVGGQIIRCLLSACLHCLWWFMLAENLPGKAETKWEVFMLAHMHHFCLYAFGQLFVLRVKGRREFGWSCEHSCFLSSLTYSYFLD